MTRIEGFSNRDVQRVKSAGTFVRLPADEVRRLSDEVPAFKAALDHAAEERLGSQ